MCVISETFSSQEKQTVSTSTMSAVGDVLDSVWTLVSWLERDPFGGQEGYNNFTKVRTREVFLRC